MPAETAETAIADAWDALGVGCVEHDPVDGEVRLDYWVPPERAELAHRELARLGTCDPPVREGTGWQDAMRRFHTPITIAGRLHVRPPWTEPMPNVANVVIDPGMAFGTGQHDTTRGCLELLCRCAPGSLIDIGCGSGILAIAARRLGFDPVWACDVDQLAVDATLANARVNGVAITVTRRDVLTEPVPPADLMVANMTATLLRALAPRLAHPAPTAILSGLRPDEVDGVAAAYVTHGYVELGRHETAEWAAVHLSRPETDPGSPR
ncbi:MAG: 50S ribosomal protein L11 methyltransferase [Actinobacteria bacterium]|nr:50S ribosomal protein L11 methyltransferase [Actinomycetota bacterium]